MMPTVTKPTTRTRRRATRRSGYIYLALIGLLLAIAITAALALHGNASTHPTSSSPTAHSSSGRPIGPVANVAADLGAIAPADTTFGVLLPTSVPNAWQAVTTLGDTRMRLGSITLPSSVNTVGHLFVGDRSHAADSGWPGTDVVVLLTSTRAQAVAVERELAVLPDIKFAVASQDNEIVLTQQWQDPTALLRGARLSTVPSYRDALAHRPSQGSGLLWSDARSWLTQFAAQTPDKNLRTAFTALVDATVPPGQSTWIGAATTDAYTYSGSWIGQVGTGKLTSPAPAATHAPCAPTTQVCGGITRSTPQEAAENVVASMVQVSGGTDRRYVQVDLASIENLLGIGGMPAVSGLTAQRASDGGLTLKILHS